MKTESDNVIVRNNNELKVDLKSDKYPRELLELYSNNYPYTVLIHAYHINTNLDDEYIINTLGFINPEALIDVIDDLPHREMCIIKCRFQYRMNINDIELLMKKDDAVVCELEKKALRKLIDYSSTKQYDTVMEWRHDMLFDKYLHVKLVTGYKDEEDKKLNPDIDFSVRAFNCLMRCGLIESRSIKNLPEITLGELYAVRNLGIVSIYEIYTKIKEKLGINLANNKVKLNTDGKPYFRYPNVYIDEQNCVSDSWVINRLNILATAHGCGPIEKNQSNQSDDD